MATTINQQWTSYSGFTSTPTTRFLTYNLVNDTMYVNFYYEGFGVNALGGVHSFTIPLPDSVGDSGSMCLGGTAVSNFNQTLDALTRNSICIPAFTIDLQSQNITISFDNLLNNASGNIICGNFIYTFGAPY